MEITEYKALHQGCIIKKHTDKDKTDSKIIIPETAHFHNIYNKTELCEVISVSNKSEFKGKIQEGDFLLCNKGEGIRLDKKQSIWYMKDKWIYAKVDENFKGGTIHVG